MIDPVRVYYLAIAAVVALLAWFVFKTGMARNSDHMAKSPEQIRRAELVETRKKIRRQIEILKSPSRSWDYTNLSRENVRKLQEILDGIDEELNGPKTLADGPVTDA
jgi:hypothetical protein